MSISEPMPMSKPGLEAPRRIEVFTGAGRRRAWTPEEKAAFVAESHVAGETVCGVARRHGLTPQPAAANNHDPARLVVGKASAPFDTDPVVSSARTAQWWPSSESADRCLGAKAADRLLEICDRRGCAGRSRDNGRLKTNASPFSIFRGLISSGGSR